MSATPPENENTVIMSVGTGAAAATYPMPPRRRLRWVRLMIGAAATGLALVGVLVMIRHTLPPAPNVPPATVEQSLPRSEVAGSGEASVTKPAHAPDPLARLPAPAPPASAPDSPVTPRQALQRVFEGRDPAHAVTAGVSQESLRIGRDRLTMTVTSSRPGYVYLIILRNSGSDVELLFPNAVDGNNHIEAGQPLRLPGPRWPMTAEGPPGQSDLLLIVSDEPRDFSALAPRPARVFKRFRVDGRRLGAESSGAPALAGTVVCASTPTCSESYGAATFSIATVEAPPAARDTARPLGPAPPAAAARPAPLPQCSDLLERASLGEPLTPEEHQILTQECR